ncbi:hypothetical protein Ancab_031171 [Ancistrocladus abbreviatus]
MALDSEGPSQLLGVHNVEAMMNIATNKVIGSSRNDVAGNEVGDDECAMKINHNNDKSNLFPRDKYDGSIKDELCLPAASLTNSLKKERKMQGTYVSRGEEFGLQKVADVGYELEHGEDMGLNTRSPEEHIVG